MVLPEGDILGRPLLWWPEQLCGRFISCPPFLGYSGFCCLLGWRGAGRSWLTMSSFPIGLVRLGYDRSLPVIHIVPAHLSLCQSLGAQFCKSSLTNTILFW